LTRRPILLLLLRGILLARLFLAGLLGSILSLLPWRAVLGRAILARRPRVAFFAWASFLSSRRRIGRVLPYHADLDIARAKSE
jgi:hypothetical protein